MPAGDFLEFAHGTSLENAQQIMANGLDATAARANAGRGFYARPGYFFAHWVDPVDPTSAVQSAYLFGFRKADQPVVLIGRLPTPVFQRLRDARLVRTGPLPGTEAETVFDPASYDVLNQYVQWRVEDPYGRV